MKELGILFSASMVRALLAGTKMQTRRIVKPQPSDDIAGPLSVERFHPVAVDKHGDEQPGPEIFGAYDLSGEWGAKCPYGEPGDRLWVREAYRLLLGYDDKPPREVSDGLPIRYEADGLGAEPTDAWRWGKLRPGMFMCRWMSRITLEIVSVKVERLQDISEADAYAEGITEWMRSLHADPSVTRENVLAMSERFGTGPRAVYSALWESLNGPGSWDASPWVWVVEFKRVTP